VDTAGGTFRQPWRDPEGDQCCPATAWCFPLSPQGSPKPHPNPTHENQQLLRRFAESEIASLTDELFRTFLVYVASSPRPAHELLRPSLSNLDEPYAREFVGMTTIPVTIDDLIATRERLIADIGARLDANAQRFLMTLHDGEPDFDAIGLPQAAGLPAVRWKLLNLRKLLTDNSEKHRAQKTELTALFT